MKSMPPSGVFGVTMDDEALIEAEIAQQLDQINLDVDDFQYEENDEEFIEIDLDMPLEEVAIPDGMSDYINQIQRQASNFEKELAECDELLKHDASGPKTFLNEEDVGILEQLAKESGESPEAYRKRVLEVEEDFEVSDFSSLLVDDEHEQTENNDNRKALVHLDEKQLEFQRMFQETMKEMEESQKNSKEKLKQEILEDRKREKEDLEEKEKKWMEKFAALQREETQLVAERKIQQEKLEVELKDKDIEIEKELKCFEEEIKKLETETKLEQEQLEQNKSQEITRQETKRQESALKIQASYRGYSVRKQYKEMLHKLKEERMKRWEEDRVRQMEDELQRQKEEDRLKREKEEAERKAEEEEKRKKVEEEERKRAEEEAMKKTEEEAKRRAEEEAKRKVEEEARKKAEEEVKMKAEEEARKKAEEEARRKAEEVMRRKAEEEARKREEEEAKHKAEEEARRKAEEELQRKEEEAARKRAEEEARKREEEEARKRAAEEEVRKREEEARKREEEAKELVTKEVKKKQEFEKARVNTSKEIPTGTPRSARSKPKSAGEHIEDLDIFEMDDSKKLQTSSLLLQGLPESSEKLRLRWIKECIPWSKVSNEPWKLKSVTSKSIRRPTSAKKLQLLSEDTIVMAARVSTLRQVSTVELQDLPGCNISTLGQCWGLKSLKMSNCNLTVVEGLQQCKQLQFLDLQENFIQYVDLKDLSNLTFLDLSHNSLSSIHGLSGCSNLRWLDLCNNKITRIGGMESLRRLHTLRISHNQLISTAALNDTPTLQMIDISNNHLQTVEDISKLCLLQTLMASSNNLQQFPCLRNHVLMRVLCLEDNSITDLEELECDWLPLLEVLNLSQNSIEELVPLNNLLILRHFDISHNQVLEIDSLSSSVEKCVHLASLCVAGNPATELNNIDLVLPSLKKIDDKVLDAGSEVKSRTSFEAMCLSQGRLYTELANNLLQDVSIQKNKTPWDLGSLSDLYFKYCDTTQKLAEEHRYTHEYGEVTIPIPTAPSTPKSSQRPASSKSVRQAQRESQLLNPKEMFERAIKSSEEREKDGKRAVNGESSAKPSVDGRIHTVHDEKKSSGVSVKTIKALVDEDINMGFDIDQNSKLSSLQKVAATKIQALWRGHRVRRQIWGMGGQGRGHGLNEADHEILLELHRAATKIQAVWRGYILRVRLEQALEFAKFEDEDEFDFQEVDLKDFNFDEEMIDDWKPPPTPQLPANHPVLGKPPSGKQPSPPGKIPILNLADKPQPLSNPRRAWRGLDSPLSDIQQNGHVPHPPSIVSETDTHRTAMSKKEEQLSEEWGFKDSNTAHLMMQRAKKLKYNAERRKKLGKLDPKQRLALFRRLEETNVSRKPLAQPSRQTLPRKEYFQARQEEINKQELEKRVMANLRNSRTFEWLHNHVGSFEESEQTSNPVMPARQMYATDNNLPRIGPQMPVRLVGSPALDLQSVDSVSIQGEMVQPPRRFSVGSEASGGARFPPIKSNSAGSGKKRERISFRDNEVKLGIGWGGGKKRGKLV